MTRWQRWSVLLGGAVVGGAIGSLLGRGSGGGAGLTALGLVAGLIVTSSVLRLIEGFGRLLGQQRGPRLGPGGVRAEVPVDGFHAGSSWRGGPRAIIDAVVARDPELPDLVPEQLRAVPGLLQAGESLVNLAAGTTGGHPGLLVLTDRRILFLPKDHPASPSIEIALAALNRIDLGPADLLGSLTVIHDGGTRTFEVPDRAQQEMGEFLRARVPSN